MHNGRCLVVNAIVLFVKEEFIWYRCSWTFYAVNENTGVLQQLENTCIFIDSIKLMQWPVVDAD